jgi:hypothetical protein
MEPSPVWCFTAELWRYSGDAAWHFLTLPFEVADEIEARTEGTTRGFGSVRVRVVCGSSAWETSVFPDRKTESYLLPVKKSVRVAEALSDGDQVEVTLQVI